MKANKKAQERGTSSVSPRIITVTNKLMNSKKIVNLSKENSRDMPCFYQSYRLCSNPKKRGEAEKEISGTRVNYLPLFEFQIVSLDL